MALTRRQFLMRVGQAGGYSAAFVMMQSLGLLAIPEAAAEDGALRARRRQRHEGRHPRRGIAGLVAAYELGKAG